MWTHFWDMHSGGGLKEKQQHIFIEASEAKAKVIFYNRFGHNPERVTCTCCGPDYAIDEGRSLEKLTLFHRSYYKTVHSQEKTIMSLKEIEKSKNALIIRKNDIKPEEYEGTVPTQGYVWME